MELELLRKIGLTEGEIRVYKALMNLGSSPTGKIMKKSGISSSKIYLILEKLINKGLVSFIVKDNIKNFQLTNPETILDYIEKERQDLEEIKEDFKKIIPEINLQIKTEEDSAQIYKGTKGIKVAYYNILNELKPGEEYCFFAISAEEAQKEEAIIFFTNFHKQRIERNIRVRVISDSKIEKLYKKTHLLSKLYKIRHYKLTLPVGVVIGKTKILYIFFGQEEPIAHEITSKNMAKKYQEFFDEIWKIAKS